MLLKQNIFLLSILKEENNIATSFLAIEGLNYISAQRVVELMSNSSTEIENNVDEKSKDFDKMDDFTNELQSNDDDESFSSSSDLSLPKKGGDPKSTTPVFR